MVSKNIAMYATQQWSGDFQYRNKQMIRRFTERPSH